MTTTLTSQEEPATLKPISRHIIPVELSTEYQEVIEFLSTSIHPFLARLKEKGIIKQDLDVMNLTPDYTRFAVKQVQMMIKNRDDHDNQLTCKLAVCLHVLVGVLELVVHCGMGVALGRQKCTHYVRMVAKTRESHFNVLHITTLFCPHFPLCFRFITLHYTLAITLYFTGFCKRL